MKRGLAVSLLFACAAAGVLSAYALAGGRLPAAVTTLVTVTTGTTSTGTTTTGTTTGTTTIYTTTTATTTTVRKPPPPPKTLPEGVTVGGVPVGNLLPGSGDEADQEVLLVPAGAHSRPAAVPREPEYARCAEAHARADAGAEGAAVCELAARRQRADAEGARVRRKARREDRQDSGRLDPAPARAQALRDAGPAGRRTESRARRPGDLDAAGPERARSRSSCARRRHRRA